MGTWATAAEVGEKLPHVTISGSSTPTTSAVDSEISDREAILRSALQQGGWSLTQANANADAYLRGLVRLGAAGWVLGTRSRRLGSSHVDDTGKKYEEEWAAAIKKIEGGLPVIPDGTKMSGGPPDTVRGGVTSTFIDGTVTELTDSNVRAETFFGGGRDF